MCRLPVTYRRQMQSHARRRQDTQLGPSPKASPRYFNFASAPRSDTHLGLKRLTPREMESFVGSLPKLELRRLALQGTYIDAMPERAPSLQCDVDAPLPSALLLSIFSFSNAFCRPFMSSRRAAPPRSSRSWRLSPSSPPQAYLSSARRRPTMCRDLLASYAPSLGGGRPSNAVWHTTRIALFGGTSIKPAGVQLGMGRGGSSCGPTLWRR